MSGFLYFWGHFQTEENFDRFLRNQQQKCKTKQKIEINEVCELSQDSYYTRNPEDSAVPGDIGPNSPESIFVKSVEIIKYEDKGWFFYLKE